MGNCCGGSDFPTASGQPLGGKPYTPPNTAPPANGMTPDDEQRRQVARAAAEERARQNAVRGTQRYTYVYLVFFFLLNFYDLVFPCRLVCLVAHLSSVICFACFACSPKRKPAVNNSVDLGGKSGPDISVSLSCCSCPSILLHYISTLSVLMCFDFALYYYIWSFLVAGRRIGLKPCAKLIDVMLAVPSPLFSLFPFLYMNKLCLMLI